MQKACIVIPCYNEALRLRLDDFEAFIKARTEIDFLFVNDGSTDSTLEVLTNFRALYPQRVQVLNLTTNSGKAEAVRRGVCEAYQRKNWEYLGFWDADLATPLHEIPNLLEQCLTKNLAIGSRMKRLGAKIERKRWRHLLGRVFSTFASIILKLPVYDTQCGAKLFKADMGSLFESPFITKWLFDIELLARYRNTYGLEGALNDIIEVPIGAWEEKGGSKLKVSYMLKVPLELMRISKRYNS
jgi:glycosyltransferase involved in cell wall biosynthesis